MLQRIRWFVHPNFSSDSDEVEIVDLREASLSLINSLVSVYCRMDHVPDSLSMGLSSGLDRLCEGYAYSAF